MNSLILISYQCHIEHHRFDSGSNCRLDEQRLGHRRLPTQLFKQRCVRDRIGLRDGWSPDEYWLQMQRSLRWLGMWGRHAHMCEQSVLEQRHLCRCHLKHDLWLWVSMCTVLLWLVLSKSNRCLRKWDVFTQRQVFGREQAACVRMLWVLFRRTLPNRVEHDQSDQSSSIYHFTLGHSHPCLVLFAFRFAWLVQLVRKTPSNRQFRHKEKTSCSFYQLSI